METQVAHETTDLIVFQRRTSKDGIQFMQGCGESHTTFRKDKGEKRTRETVTNLVNSLVLLSGQVSLPVDGILLEKIANFVTRREEVVVTEVLIVLGGEFALQETKI